MSIYAMEKALKALEKIYEGCGYIIEDKLHKDAVDLAGFVRKDCIESIEVLNEAIQQQTDGEWVELTDEEVEALTSWWPSYDQMPALKVLIKDVQNSLRAKNET